MTNQITEAALKELEELWDEETERLIKSWLPWFPKKADVFWLSIPKLIHRIRELEDEIRRLKDD